MSIDAGRVLSERYRLIRPVGQGSQASVWIAEHLALQTHVAVKLIDPELAKKDSARERFKREATAAAQLRSAHVVQILDHGIDGDQPFIVMELLDGEDLFERLSHRSRLTLRETSRIVTQVGRALSRAHAAGIIHRDLKPENVFLVPNEDDEVVKVLDFGVAKISDPNKATRQTSLGTLIGTPHYMSPEQVKGTHEIDYRTDLWALGIIAFQCVTGELPFDSEGVGELLIKISINEIPIPSKFAANIPPAFDAWFARACDRDPNKRFQSARELAIALAAVVTAQGETTKTATIRPPEALKRPVSAFPAAPRLPSMGPPKAPVAKAKVPREESSHELDSSNLEEVSAVDDEDDDGAPTRMRPPPPETDIDFDDEPEPPPPPLAVRGSHIEFPLLTRTGQGMEGVSTAPVVVSKASPVPQFVAPVMDWPPASSPASPKASRPPTPPPRPPRPTPVDIGRVTPPPSRPAQAAAPISVRPSTVGGLSRSGQRLTDPPPELDGLKRRRMVRLLIAGLLLAAAGVTWTVVRSQLALQPVPAGGDTASAPVAPPPAPSPPASTSAEPPQKVVEPGKLTRPVKPTPTGGFKGPVKKAPKKVPDGVIEIPDGPDDSVPPAP